MPIRAMLYNPVRSFGRTYTKQFDLLGDHPYHQDLSLLQSRIIFEIHQGSEMRASELARELNVNKGYLSRSVTQLLKSGNLVARQNKDDKREKYLRLSRQGLLLFNKINKASEDRTLGLARKLEPKAYRRLAVHLASVDLLLGGPALQKSEIQLRGLRPGDLGWAIGHHGEVYHSEFGWNMDFEKLVGEIVVAFATKHDPARENAWIAEARGIRLGCIFLVKDTDHVAKLRILLVDPMARGLGIGSKLVRECVRFARKAHYRKLTLWTNSVLHSARKIYVAEGFCLVKEERHKSFGQELVGQFWELNL